MSSDAERLLKILSLIQTAEGQFEGLNVPARLKRVFGGQILAQALSAALNTVSPQRRVHSMHAYVIRPGKTALPILFDVETLRDGGSFSTRRVVASQNDEPIFITSLSFQGPEPGPDFQVDRAPVVAPDTLEDDFDRWNTLVSSAAGAVAGSLLNAVGHNNFHPIECRPVAPVDWVATVPQSAQTGVWLRLRGRLGDSFIVHQLVLTYMSDLYLYGTALRPHGLSLFTPGMQPASLDHSIWFHDQFRADEWLYYELQSAWSGNARGLNFGKFYTQDGRLVASTAQEGLMRVGSQTRPC